MDSSEQCMCTIWVISIFYNMSQDYFVLYIASYICTVVASSILYCIGLGMPITMKLSAPGKYYRGGGLSM